MQTHTPVQNCYLRPEYSARGIWRRLRLPQHFIIIGFGPWSGNPYNRAPHPGRRWSGLRHSMRHPVRIALPDPGCQERSAKGHQISISFSEGRFCASRVIACWRRGQIEPVADISLPNLILREPLPVLVLCRLVVGQSCVGAWVNSTSASTLSSSHNGY